MQPARLRRARGFGALGAVGFAVLAVRPAYASLLSENLTPLMAGTAPLALTSGALAFGGLAVFLITRIRSRAQSEARRANAQLAALRARLDEAQGLLEGMPEITIRFADGVSTPSVFGPLSVVLPAGRREASVLDLGSWLEADEADSLAHHIKTLREHGEPFDLALSTLEGRLVRAIGRTVGAVAVVWLRAAFVQPKDATETGSDMAGRLADRTGAEAIFSLISKPAWVRDPQGRIAYVNGAYRKLAKQLGLHGADGLAPEVFPQKTLKGHLTALAAADGPVTVERALNARGEFDLVVFPLADGTAGYLRRREENVQSAQPVSGELAQIGGVINALKMPIAIFDARRQLVQANTAYAQLWELDMDWLQPGLREQTILDRLRTKSMLPAEVDYRAWRTEHMKSYGLTQPRDTLWHLPDGRALNVAAVPASSSGGVIYVFEDRTEQLALESRFKALTQVQNETINALSEAVAVFGTNGRLALSNPRLSTLWKLPLNELEGNPHIDAVGAACGRVMPDGSSIWRDFKELIVDLNPTRSDKSGRRTRADGRTIDYAAVRLPDGKTMITFLDVTEAENFKRVLKERNDALEMADKLKDAFVQNVSYELRSPLTNIIGFADLLASGTAGALNDKQKSYTDYIRASTATLGVLIDNILDLTNVDAGIVELDLREQDVAKLVEKTRAGLAATFAQGTGQTPVNLEVEIAPDLPPLVADGTRIVQVLYNLLANAARFSQPGAVVRLTIAGRGDERVLFTVEDEGSGVPPEAREDMFQRFEGHSSEGRQRGAGLGLAIVRAFVNLHGGTVTMEERQPKGTRVIVNLPANASAAQGTSAAE